jgi:hypothetical protein
MVMCRPDDVPSEMDSSVEVDDYTVASSVDEYTAGSATGDGSMTLNQSSCSACLHCKSAHIATSAISALLCRFTGTCCSACDRVVQRCAELNGHCNCATGLGVAATMRRLRLYVEANAQEGSLFLSPQELTRWTRATSR